MSYSQLVVAPHCESEHTNLFQGTQKGGPGSRCHYPFIQPNYKLEPVDVGLWTVTL